MIRFFYKLPAILYAILVFWLSSIPKDELPEMMIFRFDKLLHLAEYTVFGILLMLAYSTSQSRRVTERASLFALTTGILYGGTDELHQLLVPGRYASVFDLIADAIGISLGIYLFSRLNIFRKLPLHESD
jgi:VanZ family protein